MTRPSHLTSVSSYHKKLGSAIQIHQSNGSDHLSLSLHLNKPVGFAKLLHGMLLDSFRSLLNDSRKSGSSSTTKSPYSIRHLHQSDHRQCRRSQKRILTTGTYPSTRSKFLWSVLALTRLECAHGFLHGTISIHPVTTTTWNRRRLSTSIVAPTTASSASSSSSFDNWQAGDVYADLDRLEKAIQLSQADTGLSQSVRLECLDYAAQQKRPLSRIAPRIAQVATLTTASWWLVRQAASNNSNGLVGRMSQRLGLVYALQFWVYLVWSPMFLFWGQSRLVNRRRRTAGTKNDVNANAKTPGFDSLSKWREPLEYSSNQVARHVLEHWLASVAGAALLYPWVPTNWRHLVRLVVRMAVPTSWRLYEKIWFLLHRPGQPRPLTFTTQLLQQVTRIPLFTPWTVSWELAIGLHAVRASTRMVGLLYAMALAASFVCRWLSRYFNEASSTWKFPRTLPMKRFIASVLGVFILQLAWVHRQTFVLGYALLGKRRRDVVVVMPLLAPFLERVVKVSATTLACAMPLAYIFARLGRLHFFYSDNISLSVNAKPFFQKMNETKTDLQWRYRYEWIDQPKRIGEISRRTLQRLCYIIFLSGSVEEKLLQQAAEGYSGLTRASGIHILDRIREDLKRKPEAFAVDRSMWKQRAMEEQIRQHENNYAQKRADDPLGMALYLQYGIGLGLGFDQDKSFSEGKKLTTRRLQARAAKSAVRRAIQLYDQKANDKQLNNISDPEKRERRQKELREETKNETRQIADRLTSLVPTDMDLEAPLERYQAPTYKQLSRNEYVVDRPKDLMDLLSRGSGGSVDQFQPKNSLMRRIETGPASVDDSSTMDPVGQPESKNYETYQLPEHTPSLEGQGAVQSGKNESKSPREATDGYPPEGVPLEGNANDGVRTSNETQENTEGITMEDSPSPDRDDEFIEAWTEHVFRMSAAPSSDDDDDIALC